MTVLGCPFFCGCQFCLYCTSNWWISCSWVQSFHIFNKVFLASVLIFHRCCIKSIILLGFSRVWSECCHDRLNKRQCDCNDTKKWMRSCILLWNGENNVIKKCLWTWRNIETEIGVFTRKQTFLRGSKKDTNACVKKGITVQKCTRSLRNVWISGKTIQAFDIMRDILKEISTSDRIFKPPSRQWLRPSVVGSLGQYRAIFVWPWNETHEQNRNNKLTEIERFDWFIERIQTRVALNWLSER